MNEYSNHNKNVIWNMIFSLLNAAQSAILLYFVNQFCMEEKAGIFSYAFSVAVLFMYIGNYGIRNYQVSDTKEKYQAAQYYAFRVLTLLAMILFVGLFLYLRFGLSTINNGAGNHEKIWVILALCLTRLAECLEDVFHGRYQQKNALYLAGIQGTIRILVSNILFVVILFIRNNLIEASMGMAITSFICVFLFTFSTINKFGGFSLNFSFRGMKSMAIECFPLFSGYFLITYLGNVTKYALEQYEKDALQAYFNMIFMPVLVINLLSTMIFRPIIVKMAKSYNQGDVATYKKIVHRQEKMIGIISIAVIPICFFLGLPILSWFYHSNLADYKVAFIILLLGGTLSAYSSFLNVCIITIRGQKLMLLATFITSIFAYFITYKSLEYFVHRPQLLAGFHLFPSKDSLHLAVASTAFLVSMLLQLFLYLIIHSKMLNSNKCERKGTLNANK